MSTAEAENLSTPPAGPFFCAAVNCAARVGPGNAAGTAAPQPDLAGLLFIGDPHLASRVPGFRKDDYPAVVLAKLKHALAYAKAERLLPILLGDLFDFPRDNANWLLVELHELLEKGTLAVYGNHDCKENALGKHDSLSVLVASGHVRLLSAEEPWAGTVNGCDVVVGGTSWGRKLPDAFDRSAFVAANEPAPPSFVVWATHHDLPFPGYEETARLKCREVPGVDLVVNGHIHRHLGDVVAGATRWVCPGNIARVSRGDATRAHEPSVLRVDVSAAGLACVRVPLPYRPFEDVFHPEVASAPVEVGPSLFIQELKKLQAVRTATGVGLKEFLAANVGQFDPRVAERINRLAEEVLENAK